MGIRQGDYTNNDNADKSAPAFMNLNGTEDDKYFVIPSKKIPFGDNFKATISTILKHSR